MIVTVPLAVDSSVLVSSTVPEPDASSGEVAWSSGVSYAAGNTVVRSTTHRRYKRLAPGGVDAALPENAPSLWADAGPTNRYAMFERDRNTQTIHGNTLTVQLAVNQRVDTLGLLGLRASYARVVQTSAGTTLLDRTYGLLRRDTRNWSDYFFGGFKQLKNLLRRDLVPVASSVITVTLTNASEPVRIAGLVVNKAVYIGRVLSDAESDARNFSEIERDNFGGVVLRRQRSVPNGAYTVIVEKSRVDELLELRDEQLNGVPALWSGLDDLQTHGYFGMGLIYGIYTRFKINARHPGHAVVTLTLEEI